MTYFELFSFIAGVLVPLLVVIGYGIVYTINDKKENK